MLWHQPVPIDSFTDNLMGKKRPFPAAAAMYNPIPMRITSKWPDQALIERVMDRSLQERASLGLQPFIGSMTHTPLLSFQSFGSHLLKSFHAPPPPHHLLRKREVAQWR